VATLSTEKKKPSDTGNRRFSPLCDKSMAAHEGKSYAQFQKERPEMLNQTALEVPLPGFSVKTQEVKRVRVL